MDTISFLDNILKYITIITAIGGAISFVVGLIKWLDQRNLEEKNKRYEQYNQLIKIVSGNTQNQKEDLVTHIRLLASIYQLQNYDDYREVTIPVLEWVKRDIQEVHENFDDFQKAKIINGIDHTINRLNGKKR